MSYLNAHDALRFVALQAEHCRHLDEHEALCLLLPAVMRVFALPEMTAGEASEFRRQFKQALAGLGDERIQKRSTLRTPGPAAPWTGDFRDDPNPSTVGCGGPT